MATESLSLRKRPRDTSNETTCSHRRTRSRLTPPSAADSSSTSEPSVTSDTSALVPTSVPEDSTDATVAEHDSDTESDLSESSEDPSSDSSSDNESNSNSDDAESDNEVENAGDENDRVNLPANRGSKPVMKLRDGELGEDVRPWLKEFLPRLRAANEELEKERKTGALKDKVIEREDEEGQYIEMVRYYSFQSRLGLLLTHHRIWDLESSKNAIRMQTNRPQATATATAKKMGLMHKLTVLRKRRTLSASSWVERKNQCQFKKLMRHKKENEQSEILDMEQPRFITIQPPPTDLSAFHVASAFS